MDRRIVLVQHHCKLIRDVNAEVTIYSKWQLRSSVSKQVQLLSPFSFFSIHITKTVLINVEHTFAKLGKNSNTTMQTFWDERLIVFAAKKFLLRYSD